MIPLMYFSLNYVPDNLHEIIAASTRIAEQSISPSNASVLVGREA